MTRRHLLAEKEKRLEAAIFYVEAFGGDPARWPEDARALFDEFDGEDLRFDGARKEAAELDATLAFCPAPQAGPALQEKILAGFSERKSVNRRLAVASSQGRRDVVRRFIPAGLLAGMTALGFAIGAASAGAPIDNDPLYYAQATLTPAAGEEDAFWAAE